MNLFVCHPDEGGPFPVILFYHDAPGIRHLLFDMARRLATSGYYVVLPNLYYRTARDVVIDGNQAEIPGTFDHERMFELILSLTNAMVAEDTRGMIAFLDAQSQVKPGPLGCVGHCMSGSFVTTIAAQFPRMKAAASLYGVDIVTDKDDSPHLLLDKVEGELYFGFAEIDPSVPANVIPDLQAAIAKTGTKATIETYEGSHHGFCFAARPDYDPIAAERSWTVLFDLWDRNLKG